MGGGWVDWVDWVASQPPPPPPPPPRMQRTDRPGGPRRQWTPPRLENSTLPLVETFYPGTACWEPGSSTNKTNSGPSGSVSC